MLDVAHIREAFPYLAQRVYLNTASVGLSWAGAGAAAAEFYRVKTEGTGGMAAWTERAEETRRDLAGLLRIPAPGIQFVGSTTEALNLIALSMPLGRGDRIVVTEDEFPSVMLPWMSLQKRGIELIRVPVVREIERTQVLCEAVTDRTRVVAVSHVHWRTGTRVDLELLSAACRARDCRLIVDGVQAVGAVPVDASGVDAYCASVFKWLLSGFGLGFVALSEQLAEDLTPIARGYWNEPPSRSIRYGHINYPGIYVLHATLAYLKGIGWRRIEERVHSLASRAIASLRKRGLDVLTPERAHGGIVSVRHPLAATWVRSLGDKGILVEDADPIVRASAHFYNTEAEVDRFVEELVTQYERDSSTAISRGS